MLEGRWGWAEQGVHSRGLPSVTLERGEIPYGASSTATIPVDVSGRECSSRGACFTCVKGNPRLGRSMALGRGRGLGAEGGVEDSCYEVSRYPPPLLHFSLLPPPNLLSVSSIFIPFD
eukprot:Hpha_TRINITY_DN15777_c1_g2::TRINITY_DN15777_c1_g2_i1::g.40293::m.40293